MSHPAYYGTQDDELDALWIEALGRIKPCISLPALTRLYRDTTLVRGSRHQTLAVAWARQAGSRLILTIHPDILNEWYPVERAEVLLFSAAISTLWLEQDLWWLNKSISESQRALCRMLNVVCSDVLSPSERWRRALLQQVDPRSLSPDPFHDCTVCGRFVNSDEPRTDVHNNCLLYIRSVVIPLLQEWQRLEKIVAAGDQDV